MSHALSSMHSVCPTTSTVCFFFFSFSQERFKKKMGSLQLNSSGLASVYLNRTTFTHNTTENRKTLTRPSKHFIKFPKRNIRAVSTVPDSEPTAKEEAEEPASVDFAFVHSVLLPDGTPDVHFRTACGGQKLRDIMLDSNIELYGPYARPLLNCAGGGTCATCMVEIVDGKEHLNPRTDKEEEKLKRKPKNWRLACQTIVGKPDSRGLVVIQQLPEWKAHEWKLLKDLPSSENS